MARREQLARNRWLPLLGIWAFSCSLDKRQLHLSSDVDAPLAGASDGMSLVTGEGGNPSPDGGAAGDSSGPAMAGGLPTGGNSTGGDSTTPPLPGLVDGCADLDTDMVADCKVTLAKNPTFKTDVSSWSALATAGLTWDSRNALADTPSGCALLTATGVTDLDGGVPFRASQCVAVPANEIVIAYANGLIAEPAATEKKAEIQLEVVFFDAEDCTGTATHHFITPTSDSDSWVTIQAGGVSAASTKSASIALVLIKPYRAPEVSACFDNVMLKAKPP